MAKSNMMRSFIKRTQGTMRVTSRRKSKKTRKLHLYTCTYYNVYGCTQVY